MRIIGIHDGHNATACLLEDGELKDCISEERFTQFKNQPGFPKNAARWIMEKNGLSADEIDFVALSSFLMNDVEHYKKSQTMGNQLFEKRAYILKPGILRSAMINSGAYGIAKKVFDRYYYTPKRDIMYKALLEKRKEEICRNIGINKERIIVVDHHAAHASASYYGSYFNDEDSLIFTADAYGDYASATVSIGSKGRIRKVSSTTDMSLGDFYSAVTRFLGLKVWEHEYKVMGLAAYCKDKDVMEIYGILRGMIELSKKDLKFRKKVVDSYYTHMKNVLVGYRFDWIAGAAQKLTEDLVTEWVREAIKRYKIRNVCGGGGCFMNVKVNKKIIEMPEVKKFFAIPSSGDESTCIGAVYFVHAEKDKLGVKPFFSPYLGISYDKDYIKRVIEKKNLKKRFRITFEEDMEKKVASLLAKGNVVARFRGRCEYGARALGNRSILADASNFAVIPEINKMIKMRDFWMPFACSIMAERASKYLINPKNVPLSYMVIACDTVNKNRNDILAGTHQFDKTARPQVVSKEMNESYHRLIAEFEKLTGRGGVLNTSFNIHGKPLVCSPEDAINTMENSGLDYLAMEDYLFEKINKDKEE
ncbi:hypothetical protein COV19_05795 [Candidatus Woesearchaeota archaeon CG10_big_fil_rev_8_21_14_0_10_44_13]|nr:MAG: hypothetical protein COV19_05795 [Candidatus Woesearchaeota archaeon CG10_big_fil_rev_8_21_14_0_10_44_13]